MRAAVPYSSNIAVAEVAGRLGHHATPADLKREYARWVDYDAGLARVVAEASQDDPAEYRRLYERISTVDPDALGTLGHYLAERDDVAGAIEVYERYFREGKNPVALCNSMDWLVHAHFKAGRTKRALEIGQSVAETYCWRGLWTLANLYEDMGRMDQAQTYYQRLIDRYEDERTVAGVLTRRWLKGDDRSPAQRETLLKKYFPDGLEPWVADPKEPPAAGLVLAETNASAQKAALQRGDVVVGVNGYAFAPTISTACSAWSTRNSPR
jgi:tetratricopeptide (TPR) repeat protein